MASDRGRDTFRSATGEKARHTSTDEILDEGTAKSEKGKGITWRA